MLVAALPIVESAEGRPLLRTVVLVLGSGLTGIVLLYHPHGLVGEDGKLLL